MERFSAAESLRFASMIWITFLLSLLPCAPGNRTAARTPFFHGHVFENSSPGSRVNGLSVPLERLNAHRLCDPGGCGSAVARFKLTGDGSDNFHVLVHHKRGHVLVRTCRVLDREEQSEYALGLDWWCGDCARQVASIKVDVLDTNDHRPTFLGAEVKLSLDDATALRTVVYTLSARDDDSGKNAELIYFTLPRNGTFYAVPKTGDILLVDSILGRDEPVKFSVYAQDRGWPPRTSESVALEIQPRQWPLTPSPHGPQQRKRSGGRGRRSRSVMETDGPVFINVSEDAGIGSVVMNLSPVRFQSATYDLMEPDAENSPVSVSRDSGDIIISRRLDRETEPLVEITVKVQDKRGEKRRRLSACASAYVCVCV